MLIYRKKPEELKICNIVLEYNKKPTCITQILNIRYHNPVGNDRPGIYDLYYYGNCSANNKYSQKKKILNIQEEMIQG